jgi:hypothetical protein
VHREETRERYVENGSANHGICPVGLFDGIGRRDILSDRTGQDAKKY